MAHQPTHGDLQVLVYFAVAKKGDAPTDGKTDVNPEGLTAAYGPQAATVAARLHAAGLSCKVGARARPRCSAPVCADARWPRIIPYRKLPAALLPILPLLDSHSS